MSSVGLFSLRFRERIKGEEQKKKKRVLRL